MSDALDLDQMESLLANMGHVIKRCETMITALSAAPRGVDLPRGCDLSGLISALRLIEAIGVSTASQGKSLLSTLKEANKADESWGDHVKGWLTPPKTGHHVLDGVLGAPASVAAGVTDVGYDLGAGAAGLAWDIVDIPGDISAYKHGDPMPIQKPGLGFINMGAHPLDTLKALGGFKYKDDPLRMGTYAIGNLLVMIGTGGLGEAGDAGLAARLAQLTEEGSETSRALSEAIDELERKREEMPSTRQRSPGKRDYIRHKKMSMDKDIERLKQQLEEHETHMSDVKDRYNALANIRNNAWMKRFGNLQNFYIPTLVNKIANVISHAGGEFTKEVLDHLLELQGIAAGSLDYTETREARKRLEEFRQDRPGRFTWPTA